MLSKELKLNSSLEKENVFYLGCNSNDLMQLDWACVDFVWICTLNFFLKQKRRESQILLQAQAGAPSIKEFQYRDGLLKKRKLMEEKRAMDDVLRISGRTGAAADEEKGVDSVGDDHKEEVVAEVKLFVHLRSVYYMSWNIITNIIV